MLNEIKIFFDNIRRFRRIILNEAVSDNAIIKSINNRELAYLYYAGDATVMKGYRIVVPFVLGTLKNGDTVLRAWQLEGNSDSFIGLDDRNRKDHEYHIDHDGSKKIGWRLFKTDKISSFLPMGDKFIDTETGNYKTPPLYNPNDKQMASIIAAAPEAGRTSYTSGMDSIDEPDVVGGTEKKSDFEKQTTGFKSFYQKPANIQPDDIQNLYNIVKTVKHRSPKDYLIYINNKGNFNVIRTYSEDKIPQQNRVGNLKDLYNKYVVPSISKDDSFFDQEKNKVKNELEKSNMEENNVERRTFFKT